MDRPEAYKDFDLTDRPGEVWKDVVGFEGAYMVSNESRVKSLEREKIHIYNSKGDTCLQRQSSRILKPALDTKKYLQVALYRYGKKRTVAFSHRLSAIAFIPNPYNLPQVNHKDGIKTNCHINNFEWATNSTNQIHAYAIGLQPDKNGIKNHMSKLTEFQVKEIRRAFCGGSVVYSKCREFGVAYNLSPTTIWDAAMGRTYKNVI